ncbi:ulp1 protease family, C-terminal catalytic domain-containing protein, partial [Tanacetum coccineum]
AIHNQLDTLSMNNADSLQGSIVAKVDVDVNPTVAVNTLRVPLEREVKVSSVDSGSISSKNAPKTRVIVLKEIMDLLWETEEQYFYFPWVTDGTFVNSKFWQALLGVGKERCGWLSDTLACCYADGVTYGVPWFAQSVEKVYFSINVEEVHWILAELHIRSGVVTFYDTLPPEDLHVEDVGI